MAELGGILEGGIVGLAVSEAGAAVVEPALEPARQQAEQQVQARIHDLNALAQAVAQSLVGLEDVVDHSERNGYNRDELRMSVQLALRAPGVAEALTLYRRRRLDGIDDATAHARLYHSFAKAQIEYQYWPQLAQLARAVLDLPTIANAIQRGIVRAPFTLPYDATPEGGTVPAFPMAGLDPAVEAEAAGYTLDQLLVAVAEAGNPPGPEALNRARFRGAINDADVQRGLVEGRARGEWAKVFEAISREIPTVTNYVEARVRNWIGADEMIAGADRHGMSADDANLLYLVHGRPLSWHQVFIGLRRGGIYDGPTDQIDPAFLKALQESDIRPEWYSLAWAQRYSYPSAFVLRALATGGDLTYDQTLEILLFEGWEPTLAQSVAAKWTGGTKTASASPTVKSQQTAAITAIRKAYVGGSLANVSAVAQLQAVGVSLADANASLAIWDTIYQVEHEEPPGSGGPQPSVH